MPLPPISQPQPRSNLYQQGSSQFGDSYSSLSGAIPTPDLNAMARSADTLPPGFSKEDLPQGWAANIANNALRSPGGTKYQINQKGTKPSRTEQQAYSRLLNDISRAPGLNNAQASKALGKDTKFLNGKNRRLPPDLQQAKKSREEISRLGGLTAQAKRTD